MIRSIRMTSAALALLAAVPAAAETQFVVGGFLREDHHWDTEAKRILPGAEEGEEEGCWQVLKVGKADIELKLISGLVKPWWAEEPIQIGSSDTWFDSDSYREANPDHPPLSQLRATLFSVPSCG